MNFKFLKKCGSTVLASALIANCLSVSSAVVSATDEIYEFENGTITGSSTEVTADSAASGGEYVYLKDAGETVSVDVTVEEAGMYDLVICYQLPTTMDSNKIQNLIVNGVNQGEVSFAINGKFEEISVGAIKLNAGKNTIGIESSWGWTYLDYFKLAPAQLTSLVGSNKLSDAEATSETQSLMNYLSDVYGKSIISGQQEYHGQADEGEFEYIYKTTGKYPAMRGFDYMNFNPAFNWDDGTTDRIIDWVNDRNGIATVCFHWFVPLDVDTYPAGNASYNDVAFYANGAGGDKNTTFSPEQAVISGTAENDYLMESIELLAGELKKLDDANVPVIFRPLHEAQGSGSTTGTGSWFWWGTDGAEAYKELWKLLYTELTDTYGIHNLIWEFNSYTYGDSKEWYPGDEYVDLIGYDKYNATNNQPNESAISSTFYNLVDMYASDEKMVALSECDTIPSIDNLLEESAYWLYFCPWYGDYIEASKYNNPETLKSIYNSEYVISLDELPDVYNYVGEDSGETTTAVTTQNTTITTTTTSSVDPDVTTTTEENVFEIKKYVLDVKGATTITVELEGTPNASTNGSFGYSTEEIEWESEEWLAKFDANGKATVTYEIPADIDVETIEFQIWWAGLWDDATQTNGYADSTMMSYTHDGEVAPEPEISYGDVNLDGQIDIADIVVITDYIVNADKNDLSDIAKTNADVYKTGNGIDTNDAYTIQQYLSGIVKQLPFES